MAASRPAQRRGPPAHLATQTVITVEDWEGKAPLSDVETRSVNLIKAASERVPLPVKVITNLPIFTLSSMSTS